ncbi:MAG TPA: LacI family DNA-binding transcriptional regulator [Opitutaceae bacterium]|nr:LacI family DNA-binding transcriptional regulator [Opitutaceae bacterium]
MPTTTNAISKSQRVTQTDVARVAGVHNTTVSLSLRNCPSIPEATRKRIRSVADAMGYYPDPTLQALVAYRKGRSASRARETLAYLTNWDTRWGWRELADHERAYCGATKKAAELGYQLEHFWLGEAGMNQRRMGDVLYHRGITGVLVAAHKDPNAGLTEIDWSRLSAVKIGDFPRAPALHRVIDDYGGALRLAMRRIEAAGFERVGLVMPEGLAGVAEQAWNSAFMVEQCNRGPEDRVPILRLRGPKGPSSIAELDRWFQEYQPDAVMGGAPEVLVRIRELGLKVPRDVAYADLCLERTDFSVAGVRQNGEIIGEVATAMLVGQLQQNLCGTPAVGTSTMVDGTWFDGTSLAKTSAPAKTPVGIPAFGNSLLAPA